MKQILTPLLLIVLSINLNILSNKSQYASTEKQQTHFTKLDWVKLGLATAGCASFGIAGISFGLDSLNILPNNLTFLEYPGAPIILSLCSFAENFLAYDLSNNYKSFAKGSIERINAENLADQQILKILLSSSILCGSISIALGLYAYKKLTQFRKIKPTELKNNIKN